MKTILYTIIALVAFAGNSVLCRYALKGDAIDASSFTSIRLLSGAVFLIALVMLKNKGAFNFKGGSWSSAFYLFVYMVTFSYAYITLDTGIGALILFGAVQMTMVIFSIVKGKKLQLIEWIGLIIAFAGLALLLLPSGSAPSLMGFVLMAISGIAWGGYTLAGKGAKNPLIATSNNFLKTAPFVIALFLFTFDSTTISNDGVILAIVSGALTSGLGYAIWYAALEGLKVTQVRGFTINCAYYCFLWWCYFHQ
ncbi:DMT family transporter [Psychromonas sp. KJ10-10]|uniref:DMT family transporter n=1 Tax=Psychromonas sp. KJ10-10 TaxID=3391823 RepID=UPI0039B5539F